VGAAGRRDGFDPELHIQYSSAGLPPEDAATQIAGVVELAFKHAVTGVRLNDLRGTEASFVVGPRE